jgi:hypothetical protein
VSDEREATAAQARRFAAMCASDVDALDDLLAAELVYTHGNGVSETKAEFLDNLRRGRLRYRSIEHDPPGVLLFGEVAVLSGAAQAELITPAGETSFGMRYLEVQVRHGDAWRLVAWQSTRTA